MQRTARPEAGHPPGRSWRALLVLAGLALGCGGCFRYVPAEPLGVPPDEEVRIRVTDDAAIRLAREFGRIRSELDVRLAPHTADSLLVSVWIGRDYPGTQFENVHQSVAVSSREVLEVRRRRLAPMRTAFVTVGGIVVFGILVDRIFQQEDPNVPPQDGGNPPPPSSVLRIRIPLGGGGR